MHIYMGERAKERRERESERESMHTVESEPKIDLTSTGVLPKCSQ